MSSNIMIAVIIYIICLFLANIRVKKGSPRYLVYTKNIFFNIWMLIMLFAFICMAVSVVNKIHLLALFIAFTIIYVSFRLSAIAINKDVLDKYEDNLIYIREITPNYSPAVVSYLYNQKLEVKKDVMATILHLCVKKMLKLDSKGIHDVYQKNKKEALENLTEDERYIYNCVTNKDDFDKNKWYKIVIEQFNKLGFVYYKENTGEKWLIFLLVLTIACFLVYLQFGHEFVLTFMIFIALISIIFSDKLTNRQPYMKYTQKGAIELLKWKKFKLYLKDFSLVNEAPAAKVLLLEKYLSYGMALNINKKYTIKIMKELNIDLNINVLDKIKEKLEESFEKINNET